MAVAEYGAPPLDPTTGRYTRPLTHGLFIEESTGVFKYSGKKSRRPWLIVYGWYRLQVLAQNKRFAVKVGLEIHSH